MIAVDLLDVGCTHCAQIAGGFMARAVQHIPTGLWKWPGLVCLQVYGSKWRHVENLPPKSTWSEAVRHSLQVRHLQAEQNQSPRFDESM